ncbi:MAG TPA: Veg family protein [Ruminiclostridium sp.]
MIDRGELFQIKRDIEGCVGEKVQLRANKGRKKSFIREGVLENTYPSIFIVKFENEYENTRRVSYSYTDILTKAVELVVYKDDEKIQVC